MKISDMRNELKSKIEEYRSKGGNVYQTVDKLPYGTLTYQIIFLDKKKGLKTTVKSLYNELGLLDYKIIGQPLNTERFKMQIQAHLDNGGTLNDSKKDTPYYDDINEYIKREKAKGNNVMHEDVYRLCGYDRKNREITELDLTYVFNKEKNSEGYVDRLKNTKFGIEILEAAYRKALSRGMQNHEYLNVIHGVRLKEEREKVNIVEYIGEELAKYLKKYGSSYMTVTDLNEKNHQLLNKMRNMTRSFPLGQLTPADILKCYGYNVEPYKYTINENAFLRELREDYPNNNVENILNDTRYYKGLIRLSNQNNQNVFEYLKSKGFTWPEKVYNITVDKDDKRFKNICKLRKEMLMNSKVLNSDDYLKSDKVKEFENIMSKLVLIVKKIDNKKR